jgi:acyl dehydratase
MDKLHLEDLAIGQTFESAPHTLDADAIVRFARKFDPQPFHTDPDAARDTFFGGLAASGWHTAAITMRLLTRSVPFAGGLIGGSNEIAWPRATRPGDTLRVRSEILEIAPSGSRPGRGRVILRSETLNQRDEVVQTMTARLVAFGRGHAPPG